MEEELESSVSTPTPCLDGDNEISIASNDSVLPEPEESYIDILVSKEITFSSENSSPVTDSWLTSARADAIQWIMRTKDYFGFGYKTAFLSVSYFDRFLTRRSIEKEKAWAVRLLSVACISLAAKMEECRAPALQEYFDASDCRFGSGAMMRMELLVLSTLDWRMSLVTPFAYLHYFASKLRVGDESDTLVSESVRCIFAIVAEISLAEYRAATVAAAAILAAFDRRLTSQLLDSKLRILSSFASIENEHVLFCYALMTEKSQEEIVTSDGCVCYDSSSCMSCSGHRSNKRRRLQFLQ